MFSKIRLPAVEAKPAAEYSALRLMRNPELPVPLHAINQLSEGARRRIYRALVPAELLTRFKIDPITWRGPEGDCYVQMTAEAGTAEVKLAARHRPTARDPFAFIHLADNGFNGIDVVLVVFNDPTGPRFHTDINVEGGRTLFGTVKRNTAEEHRAMLAGLAPAQVRRGLRASGPALQQFEAFLLLLGHSEYFVEPLTYMDAWLFERRGFAYISGHKLMERIHEEFRPGGRLYRALDGSTPFRRPEQWQSVRGRAWAIHDGILAVLDKSWNHVRMVKRVGHNAGVETFLEAIY